MHLRINIGCGRSPTPGWLNFDNSPSVRLARIPLLPQLLHWFGLIGAESWKFVQCAVHHGIAFGDPTRGLPIPNGSVDVLYCSHLIEHLDRSKADLFLCEARRMLRPGGIIRLAVPDLEKQATDYSRSGDADAFIAATGLGVDSSPTPVRRIGDLLFGNRRHQWMYDGSSLSRLLVKHGFGTPVVLEPGETTISDPGPLDLCERSVESVYVEAVRL